VETEARTAVAYASELPDQPAPEPKKKATPAKAGKTLKTE
jgi:hypothetical protein